LAFGAIRDESRGTAATDDHGLTVLVGPVQFGVHAAHPDLDRCLPQFLRRRNVVQEAAGIEAQFLCHAKRFTWQATSTLRVRPELIPFLGVHRRRRVTRRPEPAPLYAARYKVSRYVRFTAEAEPAAGSCPRQVTSDPIQASGDTAMVALRAPGEPGQPLRMPVHVGDHKTCAAALRAIEQPRQRRSELDEDHGHTRMPSVYHNRSSERGQAGCAQAPQQAGWRFLDPEVAVAVFAAEPARGRREPCPPAAL